MHCSPSQSLIDLLGLREFMIMIPNEKWQTANGKRRPFNFSSPYQIVGVSAPISYRGAFVRFPNTLPLIRLMQVARLNRRASHEALISAL